jgi:hypothetical protein
MPTDGISRKMLYSRPEGVIKKDHRKIERSIRQPGDQNMSKGVNVVPYNDDDNDDT